MAIMLRCWEFNLADERGRWPRKFGASPAWRRLQRQVDNPVSEFISLLAKPGDPEFLDGISGRQKLRNQNHARRLAAPQEAVEMPRHGFRSCDTSTRPRPAARASTSGSAVESQISRFSSGAPARCRFVGLFEGRPSSGLWIAAGTNSARLLDQIGRVQLAGFLPGASPLRQISFDLTGVGLDKCDSTFQLLAGFEGRKVREDLFRGFIAIEGAGYAFERNAGAREVVAPVACVNAAIVRHVDHRYLFFSIRGESENPAEWLNGGRATGAVPCARQNRGLSPCRSRSPRSSSSPNRGRSPIPCKGAGIGVHQPNRVPPGVLVEGRFQPGHAVRDGFQFNVQGAQGCRVASLAHFERTRPLVEFGEKCGFDALELDDDPFFVFIGETHCFSFSSCAGLS